VLLAPDASSFPSRPQHPKSAAPTTRAAGARDEILVRFREEAGARERGAIRRRAGTPIEERLPVDGLQLVEAGRPSEVAEAVRALERDPDVLYAEPNRRRTVATIHPNDPLFKRLWGLHHTGGYLGGVGVADADIDAPDAWQATRPPRRTTVAVVDTSVVTAHPDLARNVWSNAGETGSGRESNGIDDDRNGLRDDARGWDWVQGDRAATDDHGHGTHVAGTIAARGSDARGVAGVNWRARIMPLKVLDAAGHGYISDAVQAFGYASAKGARIVNLSLAGGEYSEAERDAIAAAPGMLFVVAAGNGANDNDQSSNAAYPCSNPLANVLCAAASTPRDRLASLSSFGRSSIDLAAPGTGILSTQPGGRFATSSGTSMAAPHAAGVASLVLAARPRLSALQVKASILRGADRKRALAGTSVTGGWLHAARALRQAAKVR
jgi:Subtilase family/Fervidolysin N-terminal prodomain